MKIRFWLIAVLVLLLLLLSGCVENNGKKVYFSSSLNETITLYGDGFVTWDTAKGTVAGAYRIDGSEILMAFPPLGLVYRFQQSGDILIDKDGIEWNDQE